VDGVCRDVRRSLEIRYPIFSRGNWMRTGKDRVRVDALDVAVSIAGVRVKPGDLLLGDADGVVVIPAARAAEVIEAAQEIEQAEQTIRVAVEAGHSLAEARALVGYHKLQTPRDNSASTTPG
jgi:regulator of RNase E activity RraA